MAIIVSPTMPPGPHAFGDEWHHTISGLKFRWTQNSVGSGVWVQFIPSGEAPIPFDAPIITNPTPRSTQSAFAPAIADPGDFWYHSETGVEFIYYDDGNTRQWVTCQPTKVGDIIVVTGPAGGDLTGSYPNPLIKPDVELTGVPTLETSPATADDSKKIASTEFVRDAIATFSPPPDLTPYATIVYVDAQDALKANLASPTFTGDPKAPTPATADNDTSIATTAFVRAALATFAPPPTWDSVTGKPATFPPTLPIAQSGVTNLTTDLAAKAPLASPALTGNPTAPTPTTSDNDTSIATTAFVKAAMALGAPVTVSATPPASPYDGQLWFSSELLILFVRYNDGTSTQWVSTSGSGTSTAIPPGTVVDYMGGTVPSGWYLCDGENLEGYF